MRSFKHKFSSKYYVVLHNSPSGSVVLVIHFFACAGPVPVRDDHKESFIS